MHERETPENINPADLLSKDTKKLLEGLVKHTKENMAIGSEDPESVFEALLEKFPELKRSETNQEYIKFYLKNTTQYIKKLPKKEAFLYLLRLPEYIECS